MDRVVWTYEVHQLSEGYSAIVYDEHGQMVADHLTEDRARLIASAPDLFDALEIALIGLEHLHSLRPMNTTRGAIEKARAALRAAASLAREPGEGSE